MTIRREEKIMIKLIHDNDYEVRNAVGNLLYNHTDDYFIYFKSVNFKADGRMEGKYLGTTDGLLIDRYSKKVNFDNSLGWIMENQQSVKTAKLVVLNNKNGAVIIIQK